MHEGAEMEVVETELEINQGGITIHDTVVAIPGEKIGWTDMFSYHPLGEKDRQLLRALGEKRKAMAEKDLPYTPPTITNGTLQGAVMGSEREEVVETEELVEADPLLDAVVNIDSRSAVESTEEVVAIEEDSDVLGSGVEVASVWNRHWIVCWEAVLTLGSREHKSLKHSN